jgi:DNA polymerase-3 subunit epsilon
MNLKINKPFVVFDLETTGIQVSNDRIIEIYCIKIFPDGKEEHLHWLLNPTIPIPPQASEVHGIYDKDVADKPTFTEKAQELNAFLGDCDFGGFNHIRFDFPLLVEEFYRAGISFNTNRKFVDAQRIFHLMEPRNLTAAYKKYCNKDLNDAHSAKADTVATWEIIKAQLDYYPDLEKDIDALHLMCNESDYFDLNRRIKKSQKGEALFNFGKHTGQSVIEVFKKNPGYYDWMMKGDFAADTKAIITQLMLKSKNTTP